MASLGGEEAAEEQNQPVVAEEVRNITEEEGREEDDDVMKHDQGVERPSNPDSAEKESEEKRYAPLYIRHLKAFDTNDKPEWFANAYEGKVIWARISGYPWWPCYVPPIIRVPKKYVQQTLRAVGAGNIWVLCLGDPQWSEVKKIDSNVKLWDPSSDFHAAFTKGKYGGSGKKKKLTKRLAGMLQSALDDAIYTYESTAYLDDMLPDPHETFTFTKKVVPKVVVVKQPAKTKKRESKAPKSPKKRGRSIGKSKQKTGANKKKVAEELPQEAKGVKRERARARIKRFVQNLPKDKLIKTARNIVKRRKIIVEPSIENETADTTAAHIAPTTEDDFDDEYEAAMEEDVGGEAYDDDDDVDYNPSASRLIKPRKKNGKKRKFSSSVRHAKGTSREGGAAAAPPKKKKKAKLERTAGKAPAKETSAERTLRLVKNLEIVVVQSKGKGKFGPRSDRYALAQKLLKKLSSTYIDMNLLIEKRVALRMKAIQKTESSIKDDVKRVIKKWKKQAQLLNPAAQ